MNKQELVEKVHQNHQNLSKAEVTRIVDEVFESIIEVLCKDEEVKISGFGTFVPKMTREKQGINPRTKQKITIQPKRVARFKPAKGLKDRLLKQPC